MAALERGAIAVDSFENRQRNFKSLFAMIFIGCVICLTAAPVLFDRGPTDTQRGEVNINELWVLVCAALVFVMQAGFLCFEVGLSRPIHATVVAIKNVLDWTISTVGFFVVGFGLMFGESWSGLAGSSSFLLSGISELETSVSGIVFFIFQLAFAGTAITLVSGSLVERTSVLAYSIIAIALAGLIYPVYGHWVWGNLLVEENEPWLAGEGFHDFAGGTVVHLLGAVVAFVGIVLVGPRIGRFNSDGTPNEMESSGVPLAMFGVVVLWFGWWGFNGGSYLQFSGDVARTILVTNVSAVAGLVGAGFTAYLFQKSYALNLKLVGGAIGGLVAITAGADVVTPLGALATGLLAGIAYSVGNDLLLRWGLDDALGVIPAHGFGAIIGTLSLPVFAADGSFERPVVEQIGVQALGVGVCIVWAGVMSFICYGVVQLLLGLRMSPSDEIEGFEIESQVWPYGRSSNKSRLSQDERPSSAYASSTVRDISPYSNEMRKGDW